MNQMAKRPVSLEDLLRLKLVGDVQISPDGRRLCFTVRTINAEKNKAECALWMADAAGGAARPFTGAGHSDGSPRWSPDGASIAFVSDRDGPGSQLYLIAADGGEARKLTSLPEGSAASPAWSPDGARLAFTFRRTPEERTDKAAEERKKKGLSNPVRVHDRVFYRLDGAGYHDGAYRQVWVADTAGGEARALTDGPWPCGAPAWSPDGATLLFVANRRDDADLTGTRDDLWTVPADGGELLRVEAPPGPKSAPSYSPDGSRIAYIGHTDVDDTWGGRNERVLILPAGGAAEALDLTGATDLAVGYATLSDMHETGGGRPLAWSPDGRAILFPVSERGETYLGRMAVAGGEVERLTPMGAALGSFSLSADGARIGLQLGSAVEPHEAWVSDGSRLQRLSHANADLMAEVAFAMPEEVAAPTSDGGSVHGWALRQSGAEPGAAPCVLYVHGGPAGQYGGASTPFHELQWLAAQGYVVVFGNPRGSKGYGEAHTRAIQGEWGGKDWVDIQGLADHAAALPEVDPARMAIMGGSYGGYMTAWAVGHTTRFACAIADRLVANLHSMSGTCDFPWEPDKEFGGTAWNPADMWRLSPLAYADKIETPLLIIHSDGDLRCPIEQAEQLFAALRWRRKTVQMVRYPAETSHGMSRNGPPDLRLDRLRRNLAWLDRFLNPRLHRQ